MIEAGVRRLGVGSIIGRTFGIFFRHIASVLVLCFFPTLIGLILSTLVLWGDLLPSAAVADFTDGRFFARFVPAVLIETALNGVTTALVLQLAYDTTMNRRPRLGRYVGPALRVAVPIAVLSLVSGLLVISGLVLLVIPGLWVNAVFSVVVPAVVIEKVGLGGLRRSAALTKGFRWPIVGASLVILICVVLLDSAASFLVGLWGYQSLGASPLWLVPTVFEAVFSALGYGLFGISAALIYARLREIRDGVGVDDIVAVFD